MSEAAKIRLLLRRGILPQRILEPEAEVAEYVQSRVQNLALEIAGRFQVTEREAEQRLLSSRPASSAASTTCGTPQSRSWPRGRQATRPSCRSRGTSPSNDGTLQPYPDRGE